MSVPIASTGSFRGAGWTPRIVLSFVALLCMVEAVAFAFVGTSTALPSIIQHFHTTQGGWLLTSYALVGGASSPLFGKLADLYGKRRLLVVAIALAAAGDLITAVAPAFWVMVLGQALHGFISAFMYLGYSLMRDVYPKRIVPFTASLSLTGVGVLSVFAPFVIGALIDNFGFRSLYVFDLAWIAVMGTIILLTTPETALRRSARVDLLGAILVAGGLTALLLAVSMGSSWGWTSARVLGLFAAGAVLIAVYIVVSLRRSDPILNLRVLARPAILFPVLAGGLAQGINPLNQTALSLLAMTPRAMGGDYGLGLSAGRYAWVSAPIALASVLGGICVGLLVRRTGGRPTMYAGMLFLAAGALFLMFQHTTMWQLILAAAIMGLGTGLAMGSQPNLIIAGTPPAELGSMSSVGELSGGFIGAITPVVGFAIMAPGAKSPAPGVLIYSGSGLAAVLLLSACLAVVALLVGAILLRPRPGDARYDLPAQEEAVPA